MFSNALLVLAFSASGVVSGVFKQARNDPSIASRETFDGALHSREVGRKIQDGLEIRGFTPDGFHERTADINTTYYFPMALIPSQQNPAQKALHRRLLGISPAHELDLGQAFSTDVKIGSQSFTMIMDCGSSDTWVPTPGFECFSYLNGSQVPESECNFGPLYIPDPDVEPVPDRHFNIFYGDTRYLTGTFGKVKVSVGGIAIKQQIALVDIAGWYAPGKTSGVFGLAYPDITFSFTGTDQTGNDPVNQRPYDPFFTSLWKAGKIPPKFSIALSRGTFLSRTLKLPDGYLALGGLPPVITYGKWASSPIQYVRIGPDGGGFIQGSNPYPQYQWYVTTPDEFIFTGSGSLNANATQWSPIPNPANSSQVQIMIDSGTTLIYLPTILADAYNALFVPPAVFDPIPYGYAVPCNAKIPDFAVKIGGVVFPVDKRDLILDDGTGRGKCISGINNGKTYAPYVFGDVFMKNVVVVFDIGAGELRFRSRGHY